MVFCPEVLLPEQNLLWWTGEIHNLAWFLDQISLSWRKIWAVVEPTPVCFSQMWEYSHIKEPCFLIANSGSVNSYLYLLPVLLVSYHTQTYILKKPNSTKKIALEWGSSVVIFLLQLKTSALSFRSFLETSRASSSYICRIRSPIFVKPPSSRALAMMAVMAATSHTTCLLTYLCFRCAGF